MTPHQIFFFMCIVLILVGIFQRQRDRFSCWYCGRYKGHEDTCPLEPRGWGNGVG